MRAITTLTLAAALALSLAGCEDEPDEAPPVGVATAPATTADAGRADTVDRASRQADFRLAVFAARERLQSAWTACADDAGCRDRALSDYDLATATAGHEFDVDAAEVIDLQRPALSADGSGGLVQVGGSRG